MKKECNLDNLKKDYKKIQTKYSLPSFEKLNEDFQIEKIAEVETDYLLREIRKFVADKFSNYLRFIEAILHPVNAPMFVFSVIKSIDIEDKNKLVEIYKKLAKTEVRLIEVDVDFSLEKEAEFINESYKLWQGIKKDLLDVIDKIKKNWDNKFEVNNKGYLG
ncbi:hypothetical protein CMI39_03750 [Candidatus Pacearchaeota archaeon]|jgi:hypothetical protein|nr:hypothetical protein [Candidatus Pacearchaeota archaeon]|tara:strand:+ start:10799 stop:11284 length:486 start_codon:yes stop_codon:yes gene_type:complete